MKKLYFFMTAVMALYGCQKGIETEKYAEKCLAPRTNAEMTAYYWCEGEKIPLTVNKNKLFILAETENITKICKSAAANQDKLITKTYGNYPAVGAELYRNRRLERKQQHSS